MKNHDFHFEGEALTVQANTFTSGFQEFISGHNSCEEHGVKESVNSNKTLCSSQEFLFTCQKHLRYLFHTHKYNL